MVRAKPKPKPEDVIPRRPYRWRFWFRRRQIRELRDQRQVQHQIDKIWA